MIVEAGKTDTIEAPADDCLGGPKRMLAPVAYSETAMPALRLVRSSRRARQIARGLFFLLVASTILVVFAPWRQSVKGTGDVIAYAPLERQQTLETPIKGRIETLGEGVFENAHVKEGQLIALVSDIDRDYAERLRSQQEASRRDVDAAKSRLESARKSLEFAKSVVQVSSDQVTNDRRLKVEAIAIADFEVSAADAKVKAERQVLVQNEVAEQQLKAEMERQRLLFDQQIFSKSKFQEIERKHGEAAAKVAKAEFMVDAAVADLEAKKRKRISDEQKAEGDIVYSLSLLQKASGDVAKAELDIAKVESEIAKAEQVLLKAETEVSRQKTREITAPFDGFITSITPNQGSKILKPGDPICVIVPDTADRAVQIWLDGNDAPLVQPGRHVRIQFEGWPAVQFAGWPSAAVGTFGGEVISVDATDNGKGKFRALVLPDPSFDVAKNDANQMTGENGWPLPRFLRQGVRANGWVLLDRVPLWYEIWRNMNGFPPVVSTEKPGKTPKLPK
ncbi:MAG: HlyD family efflux transporter periplasmic adaptor subunit [Planctomycetota bacterium]